MPTVFAVVTTGIYCRPTCGAQPRPGNVRSFPLAAAAEAAGYRACLRCRPYRAPQSVSWTGPELVCRAVRLILDGALDAATEAQLGHRLGVSARHLRRLFMAHLGVTPDGLARSARTHFARRLLDDTDLTITEIAFAVGFGSLRQFNRACQEVFRAPPHVLRAKRRKADRLVADGGLLLRLPFSGALDWDATVAYLAARATPGVEHVSVSDGVYRRTITIAGDPGVLELYPGADDHLLLRAHLPHWEELVHLVNRARRIANLDLDLDEPARQLAADPVIGPLLQARPGVRPPGTFDPVETGVRAIIGQRTAITTANAITGRMVERLGAPVPGLRRIGLTHTFPQQATLAAADLSGLGLSSTRQTAVRAFARAVAEGAVPLDGSVSLDRLVGAIGELDGLGARTAHYLAFRLGEPDAWPLSGRDLQRVLAGNAHDARRTHRADAALPDRWRPWRALAAAHLWMANGGQQVLVAATAPTEPRSSLAMDDSKILTELNERFVDAFRMGSWELLQPILSPGFSYLDGVTGELWPMDRYIADLKANPQPTIHIDQVRVHVHGDTAVVSARSCTRPGQFNCYVDTYARCGDRWLCVHAAVWRLQPQEG